MDAWTVNELGEMRGQFFPNQIILFKMVQFFGISAMPPPHHFIVHCSLTTRSLHIDMTKQQMQ